MLPFVMIGLYFVGFAIAFMLGHDVGVHRTTRYCKQYLQDMLKELEEIAMKGGGSH